MSSLGHRLGVAGLVLAMMLAACGRPPEPESRPIETEQELLTALRDAGQQVVESAILAMRAELVGGRTYFIDGSRLEVFEYESGAEREGVLSGWILGGGAASAAEGRLTVWARGRLVVVLVDGEGGAIALLSGLLGDPLTLPSDAVVEPYPPGVVAAIGFLGEELGVDPGTIVVVDFEPADWLDACLGLGRPDEACAEVVTPGWRIQLRLGESTYLLRSDEVGLVVRRE